ncbi:2Fe-2S iron-sulfur cluster-binding protein [Alteromonas facilis]|uniref:2Fe-2S iron-sulfur cluster-binding protein n=1 Tax=Alteromonas facilis TaxID=2048004 RepID=UPI000C283BA2|nr:2Fe-2S iron-sulfur cluster binding domain-containing protein [Alteromonas facilis]
MFSLLKKRPRIALHAKINEAEIDISPKETLLQAALSNGIDFPHSCKVGGCATCKCKLLEGRVKELTDFGYVLNEEELAQGYILACQSAPETDIRVSVMRQVSQHEAVLGRIIHQQTLTPDITYIKVLLERELGYLAGQFADLTINSANCGPRSYSFAEPPSIEGTVSFYVRKVAGGQFSTLVSDPDLLGTYITIDGPKGDFWLRENNAPLLFVAGGSGLAPILAMLEAASTKDRPTTLLFAAKTQSDLYALERLKSISQGWQAPFTFIPVLSRESETSDWQGERGRVTDVLHSINVDGCNAYLCGAPALVDEVETLLTAKGITRQCIFSDRFLTTADMAPSRS